MRFSELVGKEIIGLDNAEKMGVIGDSDLVIDAESGRIESIILPRKSVWPWGKKRDDLVIPWQSVVTIGPDMIIIRLNQQGQTPLA